MLQQEVNALKFEMNNNLQQKLNANILINGLPNFNTEIECKKSIVEMVSKVGVNFEMRNIKNNKQKNYQN